MKLKKFFKPLVTVSALSMLLMGCAEDSSNGNGDSTTPPTAQSVFKSFLAGFQSTQAENVGAELAFTTKKDQTQDLTVAKGEEALYLVSLDNVMATYYATFGIQGTSTTLLTAAGSGLSLSGDKITNYAKVDTSSDTTKIPLTLTNGSVSLYAGMFALMTDAEVKELDAALVELDKAIEDSKPIEGDTNTPVLANVNVEAVQKVVDLINGNMYKVAYNSPAQSVQDAFGKAETLTLAEGNSMKFTEGATATTFEIKTGELSFAGATPEGVVQAGSVVVFLDEFKNILNGVADGETDKNTVKGETDLTTNQNLKITTDTLSSSANSGAITYTAASAGAEAGNNKVTYIAVVENTDVIDSGTDGDAFKVLNDKMTDGATKAEVEAALAELGTIYKVEYSVDTIANLIETFKASVNVEGAKTLETTDSTNYKADINSSTAFANDKTTVYCLSVSTETPRLVLNKLDGNDTTADNALENYVLKAKAKGSGGDGTISFTLEQNAEIGVPLYAYCSEAKDRSSDGDAFDTALQTGTNYEKLDAFFQALQGELVVYSYTKASE